MATSSIDGAYKRSIDAALKIDGGTWALALALAKDVRKNAEGNVEHGEWANVVEAFAEAGVVAPSGDPYSRSALREYHRIGRWVSVCWALASTKSPTARAPVTGPISPRTLPIFNG